MGDTEPIFGKAGSSPEQKPLYYDKTDSPTTVGYVAGVVKALAMTHCLAAKTPDHLRHARRPFASGTYCSRYRIV